MEKNCKVCGCCRDFLYEDSTGYGICIKDNDRHSVKEFCIYEKSTHTE